MLGKGIRDLSGRRVFVTGAASGIGRATAEAAASEGAELYLTDINAAGLDDAAQRIAERGGKVALHRAADLTVFDEVAALSEAVHGEAGSMDVVMNIAGNSTWGRVENLEHRQWKSMVDVNLMGPIHVIEHFIPPMIRAGRGGHLVNVSSAAGLIGMPWHAAYSAGKFGIRGVSEVLRFDLRHHGIGVSLVCPGAVATPLAESIEISGVDKTNERYQRLHARFLHRAVTPESAARSILKGVRRGRYMVYTSADIRAAYALQRHFPPGYDLLMIAMNKVANAAMPMTSPGPAGEP